ncbi:MAG: hypothetical protein BHW27_07400 [Faecalibacterium prausnitzii]|nr:MAG: hypothetical protein BHW27_07400 [Faecalibacterium prausnitzii]
MMQTFVRPSRDLRNHYAEISEMLKDHDHVIITNHGRGESVLINIEDYAKYEEFLHQRYVAKALAKAKQQAADPDTQWADHESVWETLGKKITKLGDTPKMCEVYRLDPAYRRMVVDQYLVFYCVNDENKIVEIHRVLRGAWNLPQYLE